MERFISVNGILDDTVSKLIYWGDVYLEFREHIILAKTYLHKHN